MIKTITILLLLGFCIHLNAQKPDSLKPSFFTYVFKDTAQKDFVDVLSALFKRSKAGVNKDTTPKKNIQVAILPAIGYSLQTGFAGLVTSNISFSSNRKDENQKLSTIFAGITYSQYNQIIFPVVANIWTKKNKFNLILDNRFINYPEYVFGVGNSTNPKFEYTTSFLYLGLGFMYDKYYNLSNYASIHQQVKPTIPLIRNTEITSGLAFRFLYDNRLNSNKADKGFYSNIVFRKNTTIFGSDNDWSYLIADTRAYIPFPKKSKNTLALWNINWMTFGGDDVPIFLMPSNGWDDTHNSGRGYIQGRFRGRNMFSLEAEYRIELSKSGLFGATVFGGLHHFTEEYFFRNALIKPAVGGGLRIKFNKHSKANLCIDYGLGINGSRGFFVNMSEVF